MNDLYDDKFWSPFLEMGLESMEMRANSTDDRSRLKK